MDSVGIKRSFQRGSVAQSLWLILEVSCSVAILRNGLKESCLAF